MPMFVNSDMPDKQSEWTQDPHTGVWTNADGSTTFVHEMFKQRFRPASPAASAAIGVPELAALTMSSPELTVDPVLAGELAAEAAPAPKAKPKVPAKKKG